MLFQELVDAFQKIDETTLRNQKTAILAALFARLTSSEVSMVSYLSVGRVSPLYDPLEFGLAGKMVIRAVAWGTGRTIEEVSKQYKEVGDLGTLVETLKQTQESQRASHVSPLPITDIFNELVRVAQDTGRGSQDRKTERLGTLIKTLSPLGAKYVMRLVMGKLRLGFSDLTILDALSWAQTGSKVDREMLEHAFNVWSDMGAVARVYKDRGVVGLAELDVVPGRPVKPMRAERLGTIPEIIEKLETFAVEPKFDGFRVQVHAWELPESQRATHGSPLQMQGNMFEEEEDNKIQVKIFSRGLEDITHQFPEIVSAARGLFEKIGAFVIDGEAIGVKPDGSFLPFQETIKRKRKYDVAETAESIPLRMYVFDVLYAEGEGQLGRTYKERRRLLSSLLSRTQAVFVLTDSTIVSTDAAARSLFSVYMDRGLEGMLCKRMDSHYLAGARNFNWVKYKRAHEADLADTIDAVVMGGYVGRGKRQKFGVGAFLIGVRGENESIVTVAKIGTGLTDLQFEELFRKLNQCKSSQMDDTYTVPASLLPDIWVEPNIIVEIEADEITESPLHSSGYALRFPRLLRFREDKQLQDITTQIEVAHLFDLVRK